MAELITDSEARSGDCRFERSVAPTFHLSPRWPSEKFASASCDQVCQSPLAAVVRVAPGTELSGPGCERALIGPTLDAGIPQLIRVAWESRA